MLLAYHHQIFESLPTTNPPPIRCEFWSADASPAGPAGVNGTDYGLGSALRDIANHPLIHWVPFCPEQFAIGTPRTMPDIHGGDGFDVLAGRARVLDEKGVDFTDAMIRGAKAMLSTAHQADAELAIMTDMSAACGSQVISDACRLVEARRYRWGVGVATATLLRAGFHVVSHRDFRTLSRLRQHLDPDFVADATRPDHHHHEWTQAHFPQPHPRASYGVDGVRGDPGPYENSFEP